MSYAGSSISSSSRRTNGDAPHFSRRLHGTLFSGVRSYSSTRLGGERTGYGGLVHGYSMPALNYTDGLELSRSGTFAAGDAAQSRVNEKQLLQDLNERFSGYIAKVHDLEQQNKDLDDEISALKQRQVGAPRNGVNDAYEIELKELRDLIEHINGEKTSVQLEQEHLDEEIKKLGEKCGQEVRLRNEADELLKMFNKSTEAASLARMSNEKQIQALLDEIAFLKKNHEDEVDQLMAQIESSSVSVEMVDHQESSIAAALREIRGKFQLKGQVEGPAEEHFQAKFKELTEAAEQNEEVMRASREELSKYRHELSQRSTELDALLGTRDSLERQLSEMEERHQLNVGNLQDVVEQLQGELRDSKWAVSRRLREYQDLLNVKMALDIEISAYRRLLDGEEAHLSSSLTLGPARPISTHTPKAKPLEEPLNKDLKPQLKEIASEGLAKALPSDGAEQAEKIHGEEDDSKDEDAKDEAEETDDKESETDEAAAEGEDEEEQEEEGAEEEVKAAKVTETKSKAEDKNEDASEDLKAPKVEHDAKEEGASSTDKAEEQAPETDDEAAEDAEEAEHEDEAQEEQEVNEEESAEAEPESKREKSKLEHAAVPQTVDVNKDTETKRTVKILAFKVQPKVSATKKTVTKEETTITQRGIAYEETTEETFLTTKTVHHKPAPPAAVVQQEVKVQEITTSETEMEEYEEIIEETVVSTTRKGDHGKAKSASRSSHK